MGRHTSAKRWRDEGRVSGVESQVSSVSTVVLNALNEGEEAFQQLQELSIFLGGTTQLIADQLFLEVWSTREPDPVGNPGIFDTEANAEEVAKTQDAIDAITAVHQLYQSASNVVVSQEDRLSQLRRMI